MTAPSKISLEELVSSMSVFLDIPAVEIDLQNKVDELVQNTLLSKTDNGQRPPVDVLADYLDANRHSNAEDRLRIVIGFSGGSLEKLKRILQAIFPNQKTVVSIMRDRDMRKRLAAFLISPRDENDVFIPNFVKECFYFPNNWIDLLRDEDYIKAIVKETLQSLYANNMGIALEQKIVDEVEAAGYESQKGPVYLVDNKEVDIAIPDIEKPEVLIMSSYQLTTSSLQSSKANEQAKMYQDVQTENRKKRTKNKKDILFINVIDGGGWLYRRNDLERMWQECDYGFSYSNIGDLRSVLVHHLSSG